jgi:dipeptide/tripeptide permease
MIYLSPKKKKILACACILGAEILERIAFYAFLGGLVVFLNGLPTRWTEINALNLAFVFLGMSYCSALVGSILADVCIGRFWAIFVGFLIYLAGYIWWVLLVKMILRQEKVDDFPAMCHPSDLPNRSYSFEQKRLQISYFEDNIVDSRSGQVINITDVDPSAMAAIDGGLPSWWSEVCSTPIVHIVCMIGFGAGVVRTNLAPYGARHWTRLQRHTNERNNQANDEQV